MEKYITSSYPFYAKNKWFGENNFMGQNVFILLSFLGFNFLGEKKEQEKKGAFIVSTDVYWIFSMLPGSRLHFLWLFLLLELLSIMWKKLPDVSLPIPPVVPKRPFILRVWTKLLWLNLGCWEYHLVFFHLGTWDLGTGLCQALGASVCKERPTAS